MTMIESIMAALADGPMQVDAIAARVAMPTKNTGKALSVLLQRGRITRCGRALYCLPGQADAWDTPFRKYSNEQVRAVLADLTSGVSARDAAKRRGVSVRFVRNLRDEPLKTLVGQEWYDTAMQALKEASLARRGLLGGGAYFWARVDKSGPVVRPGLTNCWVWIGGIHDSGYGRVSRIWRPNAYAHRFSWELENARAVPDGMRVLHECDNRKCVRPTHLWLGTPFDNAHDMIAKGRWKAPLRPRGERHHWAVLTDEQVREVRRLYAPQYGSKSALARRFGVSHACIRSILSGKTRRSAGEARSQ